jgi:hypothetical protein
MVTIKNRHFFFSQFHFAPNICKQVAQPHPALRFHGSSQYLAHLGLQCMAIVGRPHTDRSMHFFRYVPDRYRSHVQYSNLIALKAMSSFAFKSCKHYLRLPLALAAFYLLAFIDSGAKPDSAGRDHSHSIVNKLFLSLIFNDLFSS